ncbi:MAG: D-tyrosyl-tRNA(Tyr) deacylase [Oscillospiraceae bacterium]|jgi:D-tyrosyl-tRNA(Tyr) deacylase|nr:D-tyrosyl-tRNA(Tyr) deacylase [Oscillospiraceae bacterium]
MRLVIQRVKRASVAVEGKVVGQIGAGCLVLAGVEDGDTLEDVRYAAAKAAGLRIFEDADGKMNLSMADVGGAVLAVSQFTLLGDVRKGRRPSFIDAARPEAADALFTEFREALRVHGLRVETGVFQARMEVELVNDGPVTILVDSRRRF